MSHFGPDQVWWVCFGPNRSFRPRTCLMGAFRPKLVLSAQIGSDRSISAQINPFVPDRVWWVHFGLNQSFRPRSGLMGVFRPKSILWAQVGADGYILCPDRVWWVYFEQNRSLRPRSGLIGAFRPKAICSAQIRSDWCILVQIYSFGHDRVWRVDFGPNWSIRPRSGSMGVLRPKSICSTQIGLIGYISAPIDHFGSNWVWWVYFRPKAIILAQIGFSYNYDVGNGGHFFMIFFHFSVYYFPNFGRADNFDCKYSIGMPGAIMFMIPLYKKRKSYFKSLRINWNIIYVSFLPHHLKISEGQWNIISNTPPAPTPSYLI